VLKRVGVAVTVHGFRSCFRDRAGETSSHVREVIEAALAHRLKDKAEAAYARGDLFAKRRKLMQDWADYLSSTPAAVLELQDVPLDERQRSNQATPAPAPRALVKTDRGRIKKP
jgi:hypothetical protein